MADKNIIKKEKSIAGTIVLSERHRYHVAADGFQN